MLLTENVFDFFEPGYVVVFTHKDANIYVTIWQVSLERDRAKQERLDTKQEEKLLIQRITLLTKFSKTAYLKANFP
jgi:hypothetical protein